MSLELTHEEIRDLLGAFALDATSDEERLEVEEHLSGCPRCRAEVADHRETASMLAAVGAPAPEGIWDGIARSLDAPIPIDRSTRRGTASRWMKGVASAAAAALVLWLTVGMVDQRQQLQQLARSVEESTLSRAATAALLVPGAERIRLASPDGSRAAETVVLPNGSGYLVADNLEALSTSRTYQLWALGDEEPISVGVLGPDPGIVAFTSPPGLAGLAITEEEAGGAVSPSLPPTLVAELSQA
jgi:anti-sigma factor RsiW